MALKDIFKVSRKTFFNPASWSAFSEVKATTRVLWDIVSSLFVQESTNRVETFSEALKRLQVTDEELQERSNTYFLYALGFLALAILGIVLSFYMLIHHRTFAGFLLGLSGSALFLSQAFRYHFWYFQIKKRKLGCTFEEWKKFVLASILGSKP